MNSVIISKTYPAPPICEKDILRYAGCKTAETQVLSLMQECLRQSEGMITYKVCYRELPFKTDGRNCDFEVFTVPSEKLAQNLDGCDTVLLFAATLGVGIDRLIAKYSKLSPAKALFFQAIGAERIEALCDTFCAEMEQQYHKASKPRFSPGYADLSLEHQKDIFSVLDCERKIGLTLNGSLMMSPAKSVTAFMGLGGKGKPIKNKCSMCNKSDCAFRGVSWTSENI